MSRKTSIVGGTGAIGHGPLAADAPNEAGWKTVAERLERPA
jgi:hypothetical protein